jgi:hypothetical protein
MLEETIGKLSFERGMYKAARSAFGREITRGQLIRFGRKWSLFVN